MCVGNHDAKRSGFQLIELCKHGNHFTFLHWQRKKFLNYSASQNARVINWVFFFSVVVQSQIAVSLRRTREGTC